MIPSRSEQCAAMVVGAGLTGAIAAFRLSQAGVRTIVLERGRRWPVSPAGDTFPTFFEPDRRCAWLSPEPTFPNSPDACFDPWPGLVELVSGDTIDIVCGAGVGGSTLLFAGMMMRPAIEDLDRIVPDAQELLDVHYPRALARLEASPVPADVLAHERYTSSKVFQRHTERAGLCPLRTPVAADWGIVRDELAGRTAPAASVGDTLYGINSGARNSTDRNYLAWAERSGLAEVRPLHEVEDVTTDARDRYVVRCLRRDESGIPVERVEITCALLVLAAGSAGTTRLLVRARDTGALPRLGEEVGRHWGNNGNRLYLRTDVPEATMPRQGGPACVAVTSRDGAGMPITLEHGPAPLPVEANMMTISGIGVPDELGHWTYDGATDSVRLQWPDDGDARAVRSMRALLDRVTAATGGAVVDMNLLRNYTFHPLGGAVLGRVCDSRGRVREYPGLYVVDGALVPGHAGGCNPAWTLAALAERCLDAIVTADLPALQGAPG